MKHNDKIFDGLLVLEYLSGNKKSFSLLVNRYHKKLCRHAYWFTHDIDVAKDIVQDSWSVIINRLSNLKDPNNFGSWAMRIVTRKALDYVNKQKKKKASLENYKYSLFSIDDQDTKESDVNKLIQAIGLLPVNHKTVLQLFYLQEYSLNEMSQILEISVGTVKSRLFNAREKLKSILKNNKDEK